ncbi:MAG: penicillin acylase family protein, partial [Polyangia bacterium]
PAIEGKRQMAAQAILDMIDYLVPALGMDATTWNWGRVHTLTLAGLLPLDALQIPLKSDPMFPNGFPRHGDNGTVDVGNHGLAVDSFSYSAGPVIRAVYELAPSKDGGPKAKNALPGGEVFDPESPHYRDLMELWRQNQTFDEAFSDADVLSSAKREYAAHGDGRVRFQPR